MSKEEQLRVFAASVLESGDIALCIACPTGNDIDEWFNILIQAGGAYRRFLQPSESAVWSHYRVMHARLVPRHVCWAQIRVLLVRWCAGQKTHAGQRARVR